MAKVLIDFEDYVLNARKGGTDSKLRKALEEEGKRVCKDEDIRCMAVQEVSSLIFNLIFNSFLMKSLVEKIRRYLPSLLMSL